MPRDARADTTSRGGELELLADLAHELRTPLIALAGRLDTPSETSVDTNTDHARELVGLARHALALVEDVLQLARAGTETGNNPRAPFMLEHLVRDVFAVLGSEPGHPDVTRAAWIDPALPRCLSGDALRLRQITVNLAANALRVTPSGHVLVTLRGCNDELLIEVADTGPGLGPDEDTKLFKPYRHGRAPRGRSGLGLSIVARLARALGGRIEVDSEPGAGTRFRVSVPCNLQGEPLPGPDLNGRTVIVCERDPLDTHCLRSYLEGWGARVVATPSLEATCAVVAEEASWAVLFDARMAANHAEEPPPGWLPIRAAAPPSRRAADGLSRPVLPGPLADALRRLEAPTEAAHPEIDSVLLIEDHPVSRTALERALQLKGVRVTTADSVATALHLAAAARAPFAGILCDMHLPDGDGVTLAVRLRELSACRHARLTLITADPAELGGLGGYNTVVDRIETKPNALEAIDRLIAGLDVEPPTTPGMPATHEENAALEGMLIESLEADLEAVGRALECGAQAEAADHLHRMRGALALQPVAAISRALERLRAAVRTAGGRHDLATHVRAVAQEIRHLREDS